MKCGFGLIKHDTLVSGMLTERESGREAQDVNVNVVHVMRNAKGSIE